MYILSFQVEWILPEMMVALLQKWDKVQYLLLHLNESNLPKCPNIKQSDKAVETPKVIVLFSPLFDIRWSINAIL